MTSKVSATNTVPVQYQKIDNIPDVNTMYSTKNKIVELKFISDIVHTSHVFPIIISVALVSLGKIYDDRCDMVINRIHLKIYKNLNAS